MSDDATSGWMPPHQNEPAGSDGPVLPGAASPTPPPAFGEVPSSPPTAAPVSPPASPTVAIPTTPPPPPPGWMPAAAGSGDGGDGGDGGGRSKKVLIGAVVAVLAIGAAGVFAVTQITGGNKGGAASPDELGQAVMESLDQEDFLGVIDLLLPGERDTFSGPAQELVSEMTRLEVLSDDASLDDLTGFDVSLEDRRVAVVPTNVDDIVNISMTADATATINGEELPLGQLITDAIGDADLNDLDTTESGLDFTLPMTAVEKDGRWYLSAFYTLAEEARISAGIDDIPEAGIEPKGGDSPEGAVDALLAGVEQLDLTAIIASLNPNEAEALQRYAPLFIDEPQSELDDIPMKLTVSDIEYDVQGSGSTRSVGVTRIELKGEVEESGDTATFTVTYEDGCATVEADGESFDSCVIEGSGDDLDDVLGGIEGLDEFRSEFEDILSDYEQPGITVKEVDGQWYVSPIATWFDQLFAVTHAIDPDEIDRAQKAIEDFSASAEEMVSDGYEDVYNSSGEGSASATTFPPFDTIPDDTTTDDTTTDDTTTDDTIDDTVTVDTSDDEFAAADEAYQDCRTRPSAEEALSCMQDAIDSGVMPDYYVPITLKYIECGVADIELGLVVEYELSDEEYTAILLKANECFEGLIADGSVQEFEVPSEYLRPECAEGRNPWSFDAPDNEELFNRWIDCIYAE